MNRRQCYLMILLLAFFASIDSFSQKRKRQEADFGFNLKHSLQKKTIIPFKVYSNLVVIKVVVNDKDTLNFILDTGVSSIFLTDPALGKKMKFKYVRKVQITGAGEEKALEANITIGHKVQIGDVVGNHQNLVVLSEDILRLSEFMGVPIHGIFGHDLFDNFVVTIDYATSQLTLTRPNKFKLKKKHGDRYPIVVTQNKPYTDSFFITAYNSEETPVRLVIDTGAGHALLLNESETKIPLPDKVIRANLGRGLNGEIFGHIGRVSSLRMGEIELKDVLASFPDSLSFSMKFPASDNDRQGSIGCEFLRRFKVTFNYSEGYMALKPIKKKVKEGFEQDMSGLSIKATGKDYKEFIVTEVSDDSPAYYAGMQEGDQIIFLNNVNMKDLTISDIIRVLARKEGKQIEVFFRRNGEFEFASFELKRII